MFKKITFKSSHPLKDSVSEEVVCRANSSSGKVESVLRVSGIDRKLEGLGVRNRIFWYKRGNSSRKSNDQMHAFFLKDLFRKIR